MLFNLESLVDLFKILIFELTSIVSNNLRRSSILIDDMIQNEQRDYLARGNKKWDNFHPISDVISSSDNKIVSTK